MLYKFLCANKSRAQFTLETVAIIAETETAAIHSLGADLQVIGLVARLPEAVKNFSKSRCSFDVKGGCYA